MELTNLLSMWIADNLMKRTALADPLVPKDATDHGFLIDGFAHLGKRRRRKRDAGFTRDEAAQASWTRSTLSGAATRW